MCTLDLLVLMLEKIFHFLSMYCVVQNLQHIFKFSIGLLEVNCSDTKINTVPFHPGTRPQLNVLLHL